MPTKPPGANAFESLRQTVNPTTAQPSATEWMTEQLRRGTPRTTAPLTERVTNSLRDADRHLKTGAIKPPTPEGSTFVKGGLKQPPVAAPPAAPTTLAGKARSAIAPRNLLRSAGRTAGPAGAVLAAGEGLWDAGNKALDGDYEGAAYDAGRGGSKAAGAWGGGVVGAKLGAAAGLATGPAAPIAAPVLAAAGGIGGAFVGAEGMERAYDWTMDKLGLRPEPAAPAPTVAPANSGIRTQNVVEGLNTRGMTPGMPGPGRVLQNNFDPELAKLPAELPGGLRQGVVHRTLDANGRPIYSGSNVGVNPQFVDGAGKTVTPRGFTGEIPGMSPSLRGPVAGSGGPVAAVEPGVQGGGMAGFGPTAAERDLSNRRRAADFAAQSRDRRTRERGMRELDALDRAELAQSQSEASLRGAQLQAGSARYAADRRLEGDLVQAEATTQAASLRSRQASMAAQMERQAVSQAWQMANGDYETAARILNGMGYDGSKLLSQKSAEQGIAIKNREDADTFLQSLSGVDGKISPELLARNRAVANDITGGKWSSMTPDERVKAQGKVTRAIKLLDGLNAHRNTGFFNAIGIDMDQRNFASIPDLTGATIDRLSLGRPGTVDRGDYRIRTKQGEEFTIPASAMDEGTARMLQEEFNVTIKE